MLIVLTALIAPLVRPLLLEGDRQAGEGVHALHPPDGDGDDRRLLFARLRPLLRLLGGDAHPDVPAHRRLGRAAEGLRVAEVLHLHPLRERLPPGRHHRPLPGKRHLQHPRGDVQGLRLPVPDLGVSGLCHRLRDQGAHVPVPHLVAGRPHRGADGRERVSGQHPPEDGDLRVPPVLPAHRPAGELLFRPLHDRPVDRRRSSTAGSSAWARPT